MPTESRLLRSSQGVSLLENKRPSFSSLSYSESSSTPGNGTTPEECPALTDSPTTLTEALQMIHPIPADSWRNLIEQIGESPGPAAAYLGHESLGDSGRPWLPGRYAAFDMSCSNGFLGRTAVFY